MSSLYTRSLYTRLLIVHQNSQQIQTYTRLIAFRRVGRVPLAETFTGIFGWTCMLLFC